MINFPLVLNQNQQYSKIQNAQLIFSEIQSPCCDYVHLTTIICIWLQTQ